jgi:hypothetical protein
VNFARIAQSERLQQVRDLLQSRGETGATTADILDACPKCKAVSPAIGELRENGFVISCEQTHRDGTMIARYRIESHPSRLIDSDPPAPLTDSDPVELGYREIPEPAPDVPAHLIGEVIRFERMAKEEKRRYQAVCEGRAADNSCILCAWICSGERIEEFPSYSRKAHVLLCADPSLPSNAHYMEARHADRSATSAA